MQVRASHVALAMVAPEGVLRGQPIVSVYALCAAPPPAFHQNVGLAGALPVTRIAHTHVADSAWSVAVAVWRKKDRE